MEIIAGVLIGAGLVQFFYILYFFARLSAYKEETRIERHNPVSVIVCAHNELQNLPVIIQSVLAQNYHHFELIIVNDRSYDGSYDYLETLKGTSERLKIIHIEETPAKMDPKKYALTLGIKSARYEILLFTDADCVPESKNWILQMQSRHNEEKNIVLGCSRFYKTPGLLNSFIRFETFYTILHYFSFALRGNAYMGVGRNLSYTRQVYFNNKGFYPYMHVTGGDDDLFIGAVAGRNNVAINTSPDSQTFTHAKSTFSAWFMQKKRHLFVSRYYKPKHKRRLAIYNLSLGLFYLSAGTLFVFPGYLTYALGIYMFRLFILLYISNKISKKLDYNASVWFLPIFEFLYIAYLMVLGFAVLFSKKVKWK